MLKSVARTRTTLTRRRFLRVTAVAGAAASVLKSPLAALGEDFVTMPFENGQRPLVKYPQKRPLIRLTTRPPQLETPFSVFNEGVLTPNDAFFVRYHLMVTPFDVDAAKFRLVVNGRVNASSSFSLSYLKTKLDPFEIIAVNQCSGNGRGFSQPRVPGGQLGNGAMGNARWEGVHLKDVLAKAGVMAGTRQVKFNGLDSPLLEKTPDFVKALDVDHAMDGEVMLAYKMNGEDLPVMNGYPLRLVVPGYYGTYWVKHVSEVTVLDDVFNGYWMGTGYRIPDTACACVEPGSTAAKTIPITKCNVRSFITSLSPGTEVKTGQAIAVKGIAFDGGYGIREVLFSEDGGRTWREADLGKDWGRYSFREWQIGFTPRQSAMFDLKVKATNRIGQSQPFEPLWNPAGYMRNVVETVQVKAV